MAEIDQDFNCLSCDSLCERQLSAVRIVVDYERYECPITGQSIDGRRSHRENLAKHQCRILEPGETQASIRNRVSQDEEMDRSIDETVDQFIGSLPESSRSELFCQAECHDVVINRL
jgi:hypothetical protein